MNKKADIGIVVMILLIVISLSLFSFFQFSKSKKTADTIALDTRGLDILYSQESQLQLQLTEIAKQAAIKTYDEIMTKELFIIEEGKIAEEITDTLLEKEFTKIFKEKFVAELDEYLKSPQEFTDEITQAREIIKSEQGGTISFQDNEKLALDLEGIKITLLGRDSTDKEIFRGIYNSKININVNLSQIGLSKFSHTYFKETYASCKNENEKIPCLNQIIPEFRIVFEYSYAFKPNTQQKIILPNNEPPKYDYEITSLNLTTRRKFVLGNEIRPINFKVAVDARELGN